MTPFGVYCRILRTNKNVSLKSLASELQVTPAYLSALEHGKKGKPSEKLVRSITDYFSLDTHQAADLRRAAEASSSSVKIPSNPSPNIYWVGHLFAERGKYLSEEELSIMRMLLNNKKCREGNAM